MNNREDHSKRMNRMKKEIEDYYKTWVHKNFQKGVKDVKVIMSDEIVVILGIEFLTFLEQSIIDDDYSKQVVSYTRRKLVDKNFSILKQNFELILYREIVAYFVDFSIGTNQSCMTIFLGKEVNHEAGETI